MLEQGGLDHRLNHRMLEQGGLDHRTHSSNHKISFHVIAQESLKNLKKSQISQITSEVSP